MARNIKLVLGYEGTDYAGWQKQQNGLGVQQVIEECIFGLFGEEVSVHGSGRTDAGVHARGQVASFILEHGIPTDSLKRAMNSNLPDDIRIYEAGEAPMDFNPQYDAKRKTYRYSFFDGEVLPPEYRRFVSQVPAPLLGKVDWDMARKALEIFEGTHDFAACCASGSSATTTVRTIYSARLLRLEGDSPIYTVELCGNGFLYNMVRIIAGTALQIGAGNISPEDAQAALDAGDRLGLGATAPAQGLMLWSVEYE